MAESSVSLELRNSPDDNSRVTHKFALVNKNNSREFEKFMKEAYPLYRLQISEAIEKIELIKTSGVLEVEIEKFVSGLPVKEKIYLQTSS